MPGLALPGPGQTLDHSTLRTTRPLSPMTPKFTSRLLAAAGLFAGVFFATAQVAAADKPVVGFSQIGAESAWRTANTDSIKGEAAKRGITLKFADAQQKQENQIKALRSFIAQNVDVIAFSPWWRPAGNPSCARSRKPASPSSSPTAR